MRGLPPKCNEQTNCNTMVECSKMGKQISTMKSQVVARPAVVSDDMVQSVDNNKNCERRRFAISELLCEFPQISRTLLYEIITVGLFYHKFRARWVPKILTYGHKTQKMPSVLTFFTTISQRLRRISQSHCTSNG
jgi:hypothetical protein